MKAPAVPLLLLAALLAPFSARADLVHFKDGRPPLEGRVTDDGASPQIAVQLASGGSVSVPRDQVERIERRPAPPEEYRVRLAALAEDDADGQSALGRWCESKGMRREASDCFRRALWIRPDHAGSLEALGYVQEGGVWMSAEEAHHARGERRWKGRWLAPAAWRAARTRDLLEARDAAQILAAPADLDPEPLLEGLRSRLSETRDLAIRALAAMRHAPSASPLVALLASKEGEPHEAALSQGLRALREPSATAILLKEVVKTRDEAVQLRLIRTLGALGDLRASETLGILAFYGTRFPVRQEAARALAKLDAARPDAPKALEAMCRILVEGDSLQRARAAEALIAFGRMEAVPFLIDALDLRLQEDAGALRARPAARFDIPGGAIGEGGFTDLEAYTMSGIVQKPTLKVQFDERPPEQEALERLTDQHFGKDASKWRAWWTSRSAP